MSAREHQPLAPVGGATNTRIAALEAALAEQQALVAALLKERDSLKASHERLRLELELLKRRIFVAQAERVNTQQLELEFAEKLAALTELDRKLAKQLVAEDAAAARRQEGAEAPLEKKRLKPKGRRDLRQSKLPQQRIELRCPASEERVATGELELIGFEESAKLAWQRGGGVCLVVARAKYRAPGDVPETTDITTTPVPPETFRRSMAAPSMLAHLTVAKFADGMPLHRIERQLERDGLALDRGTMSRWLEDVGATLGATVLAAAREDALKTAFCIATDATGIRVLPERRDDGARQPCRRGHYFVLLADKDHAFFEYTPKENSAVVAEMFDGYSGYVQADAKSVYDVLFATREERRRRAAKHGIPDDGCTRKEVACWSHARRGFWEATVAKDPVAREGLVRVGRLFELEARWADRPPPEKQKLREQYARVHLESFFAWAEAEKARVAGTRGLLPKALGYVLNHQAALMRYLEDGRLVLENNRSERALRSVAVGRKGWLFVGSDDHGASAGHLLSIVASCRLHALNPEAYLRDVLRVLAHWPKDRYLELAPKYWAATRARLVESELAQELGPLTVPPQMAAE